MTAEKPLRLFIALPAPADVAAAAEAAIDRLRGAGDVRWVARENMHLTLKFLGDTTPEKVPAIEAALGETANIFSRFVVSLGGLRAHPNPRRPQTLWIEIEEGREPLAELAGAVDRALAEQGFPSEARAYRGHLTLGRVKSGRGASDLTRRLRTEEERVVVPVPWSVEELYLVRSELRPSGPVYTVLSRFPLRREE